MICNTVTGAKNILNSPLIALMTDNNDGTYSYTYSISKPGNITLAVVLLTHVDVTGTFYNTITLSGSVYTQNSSSTLNYSWGVGAITDLSDYVSATFTGSFVPITSEAYTIALTYDDGADLYIDGSKMISNFPIHASSFGSLSMNLVAFSVHTFRIDWHEYTGGAGVSLAWSTPTISSQPIPATNFGTSSDVASSPYQIQAKCPVGYTPGGTDLLSCVVLCGDGLSYENEVCDDGNTSNGDGCRNDCMQIDSGWICVGGNKTHIDVCSKCDVGYEPNVNKDNCIGSSLSNKAKVSIIAIACLIFIGSVFNLINQTNSQSIFSIINKIQLILLIPMIGTYIPFDLLQIITGLSYCMFNFGFINLNTLYIKSIMTGISYEQPDTYLQLLSINNGSAVINIYSSINGILIILIFHILFCILHCICSSFKNANFCKKIILKSLDWVCFGWYIRYIMEVYLLMLISSLTEIYRNNTSSKSRSISFGFAIIILCFLCICIICSIILSIIAFPSISRSRITNKWCRQCFSDIKDLCLSRCMTTMFFVRRALLCIVVIIFKNVHLKTKLIIYVSIQSVYVLSILAIRPFEKIKNQMLEMLNEIFYLVLCSLLFKYNTENDWTNKITQIYIWIIISNNIIFVIISLFGILHKCMSRLIKSKVKNKKPNQTTNKSNKNNEIFEKNIEDFDRISKINEKSLNEEIKNSNISPSNNISVISFNKFEANIYGKHYSRFPKRREIPFREADYIFRRHRLRDFD